MACKSPLEMSLDEFQDLGFKSGLEVHQQLDTDKKLFCHCPVGIHRRPPDAELLRHMRPTLSELGEYDGTALMEFKTRKQIHYQLFSDTVCTYEMDDTPPFPVNQQALDIAISISLLFGCTLVDEMHVTRKQYLDGSIPTGFQRTAIVGVNGSIEVAGHTVGILQVALEEDSCREVSDRGHDIVFRTDRLSTPLVEVVTAPELRNPVEVAEGAQVIRRILRASEQVRRGAGSARADVNVSIRGGTRAEIKGVPRISWFERLTRIEACRQRSLLVIRDDLKHRGVSEKRFKPVIKDITSICRSARTPLLRKAIRRGDTIMGICLPGFGGLLGREIQPGTGFEREFSGRIGVVACLDEKPNMIHTDDEDIWKGRDRDLKRVRDTFSASHADVVVVLWGPQEDAVAGAEEVASRGVEAIQGVPNETRQAFRDGHTEFERILPGPDRMYPDTDSPPVTIESKRVQELSTGLPMTPDELSGKYGRLGLSKELVDDVLLRATPSLFDRMIANTEASPVDVAVVLAQKLISRLRKGTCKNRPASGALEELFDAYGRGVFSRELFGELLEGLCEGQQLEDLLKRYSPIPAPQGEVDTVIQQVLEEELGNCASTEQEPRLRFCMGRAMDHLRGRVDGRSISERFSRELAGLD